MANLQVDRQLARKRSLPFEQVLAKCRQKDNELQALGKIRQHFASLSDSSMDGKLSKLYFHFLSVLDNFANILKLILI